MLGSQQPVILHLLDIEPAKQSLEGVKMELIDAAFPLLKGQAPGSSTLHTQATQAQSLVFTNHASRHAANGIVCYFVCVQAKQALSRS